MASPLDEKARDHVVAAQLTDKVTAEFGKLDKFSVVPSTSARQYDDRRRGVREIAAALQADVLLAACTTIRDVR